VRPFHPTLPKVKSATQTGCPTAAVYVAASISSTAPL
jgi:hypothetical protein